MIYSENDSALLLGILMNDSTKCLDSKYPLDKDDFGKDKETGILFHRTLYATIYNLAIKGVKQIDEIMVEEFLHNYPAQEQIYLDSNGRDFIFSMKELSYDKVENIQYYWEIVRKHSLLRDYEKSGTDIKEIWDNEKSNIKNEEELNNWSIDKIISHFEDKQLLIKRKYTQEEDGTSRKKSGDKGHEIFINFKENPSIGLSFESKYLTTLWNGFDKGQLYIRSGDTSSGKSRGIVGDLACISAKEIYDIEDKKWVENPNGINNVLYIGCEMELDEECDPLMWSYVSGVDSAKITKGRCDKEETKLVEHAIDIVKDSGIWLTDMPNFNIQRLENEIKYYKKECNIEYVGFDYMLLNQSLVKEFCQNRGSGIGSRGDEVLLELSSALKNLCKKYDIGLLSGTQVNASISDYKMRDYQVLRGGKAVADKATGGSISMPITKQELNLVEAYVTNHKVQKVGFGTVIYPNFVETVYKSRFSEYPKECKIFSNYNLGNMRKQELFVTDKNFKPIRINPTIVNLI